MTYDEAMTELKGILQQLQDGQTGIEEMSAKVKRAVELIKICKEKLRSTEEEVEQLLGDLE